MIKKILIANRGEIALRIIRTCREMGIKTVAVYSAADKNSLHVRFADEAVCIGSSSSTESYLNIPRIIAAAEITNADAVHPGYGFLSENADFADICIDSKLEFIGPTSTMIREMGDKSFAKDTMKKAGVPIIQGSDGVVKSLDEAKEITDNIGLPIILKASSGGGGKGMRIVRNTDELESAYNMSKAESLKAFGSEDIYIEKLIENPRHIEVQILGDKYGNIIHLGDRDCTLQRRHQKLIEEAPATVISEELNVRICETAVLGAKAVHYQGAGTMEFLVDKQGDFYFMEMNTRLQVEHPVTEIITNLDLVKEQINIANGQKLSKKRIKFSGHSIECRINAEDPVTFQPSPGLITAFHIPGGFGIRVDTHCYAGYTIPQYYDSLIAKLIVYANTRNEAIKKMSRALEEFIVEGVRTTIPFHQKIMADKRFLNNEYDTRFVEDPNE
ncbi:MAG TPA: acetyl-CoA carboxylase biotin carboxylase subunit [Ignavibacteria bacterium]